MFTSPLHRNGFRWNPFTEQLPSDSPAIVDVFTGRYQAMNVYSGSTIPAFRRHVTIYITVPLSVSVHPGWRRVRIPPP
jgi:hypothetical protein